MKKLKISVVMAVFNGGMYLRDSIQSILDQSLTNFEFIIIDDKSVDDSAKIITSFSDPRIRHIRNQTNLGLAASLNKGIKLAKGEYIARMDADDISLPNRLEIQANYLDFHPDISVVGSYVQTFNEKGLTTKLYYPTHSSPYAILWPT